MLFLFIIQLSFRNCTVMYHKSLLPPVYTVTTNLICFVVCSVESFSVSFPVLSVAELKTVKIYTYLQIPFGVQAWRNKR